MGNKHGYDLVCKTCGKVFHHSNKNKSYCSEECKRAAKKELICPICGNKFIQNAPAQKYCSEECHIKAKNILARERLIKESQKDYVGIEDEDYVECKICGQRMTFFSPAHLEMHNITKEEYIKRFGKFVSYPSKYIDEHYKGENNMNSSAKVDDQTRKERSPFSKEYYIKRGLSENDRKTFTQSVDREYNTTLDFYINRGMSNSQAQEALKERQQTFTLEKCIKRYGEVEGRLRWEDRQDKWKMKVFADGAKICCGQSKACESLVKSILDGTSCELMYGNNEFRIFDNKTVYLYDITNIKTKKIIEFNGDIWHGNPKIYKATDKQKITKIPYKTIWQRDEVKRDIALQNGYEVLIIWESDYYKNKDAIIQQCKEFIL